MPVSVSSRAMWLSRLTSSRPVGRFKGSESRQESMTSASACGASFGTLYRSARSGIGALDIRLTCHHAFISNPAPTLAQL